LQKIEKNMPLYDAAAQFIVPSGDLGITLDCSQYQESGGPSGLPTEAVPTEFDPNRFQDEETSSRSTSEVAPAATTEKPKSTWVKPAVTPPTTAPATGVKPASTWGRPTPPAAVPPKKKPVKPADDGFGG
jgi:hypothetical protein